MLRLLFLCFCLLSVECFADTMSKTIYYYDPAADAVIQKEATNIAYGCPGWSYEFYKRNNSQERVMRFKQEDIIDCDLMDFGCNEGGILFACKALGAKKMIGIDYNSWCIQQAQMKAWAHGVKNAEFVVGDMENKALYLNLPVVDTVFLLAILDTSNFSNKQAILSNIARHAKKALYYEGHMTPESHVRRFFELLSSTDFTRFEYLGRFDGRHLIRCGREKVKLKDLPSSAITSNDAISQQLEAQEIYVLSNSSYNPCFSAHCRLIQYVDCSDR